MLRPFRFILESQRFKAVRLKPNGDPFESWQPQVQSLQMFFFCVRVMDQVQLALDGAPFEQDFVQMFASNIMQL